MKSCLGRILLLFASGALLGTSAFAQEKLTSDKPDSTDREHESFYLPSMSPIFSFVPPQFFSTQFSLADQTMLDFNGHSTAYSESWKRSFLLGVPVSKVNIISPSPWMSKKETFFETFQAVLGVAELVGAGYVAYQSVKNEQSKKKK